MPDGEGMVFTIEMAAAYMGQIGVGVTTVAIEDALETFELPALCAELGDDPFWILPTEYFQTVLEGGGSVVKVAHSVSDMKNGYFQEFGPDTKWTPAIFVSSDALDDWAARRNRAAGDYVPPAQSSGRREAQVDWIVARLQQKDENLPIRRSTGGPSGIKADVKAEALIERSDLFTKSGFDRAWTELPKSDD
jgi:hypothetical protein